MTPLFFFHTSDRTYAVGSVWKSSCFLSQHLNTWIRTDISKYYLSTLNIYSKNFKIIYLTYTMLAFNSVFTMVFYAMRQIKIDLTYIYSKKKLVT
jgi:hypothetical protein